MYKKIYCLKKHKLGLVFGSGFSMVEVVVSIALSTIVIFALTSLNLQTTKITAGNSAALRARMYLSEAIEVGKDLELSNWAALVGSSCTAGSVCHPSIPTGGGPWSLVSGNELLDGRYTRSLWLEPVYRSNACAFPNQIESTGTQCPDSLNPNTIKLISTISWQDSMGAHNLMLETYLYNI